MVSWQDDCVVERIFTQTGDTSYPGGQHAGTPHYSIRVTHTPTGIMVQCGELNSPHKNKMVCMEMLEWAMIKTGII